MKKLLLFLIFPLFIYAQSIDETLQQIKSLQAEIEQNTKIVEDKITDMKRTNPLFAEKDVFESDADYLARCAKTMPLFDAVRKQYLGDLWSKMSMLRGRLFETNNIQIIIDSKQYDANNGKWPIKVIHNDYQKEQFNIILNINREQAGVLWKNWDKVKKMGILTIDIGDIIGLAKIQFTEPLSGFKYEQEFQPMKYFCFDYAVNSVCFSPDGKYLAALSRTDYKGIAKIFSTSTGLEATTLSFFYYTNNYTGNYLRTICFSPDGKYLAAGGHYFLYKDYWIIKIFNSTTGREEKAFNFNNEVNSIFFSPDGKYLAVGNDDGIARIFNTLTGEMVRSFNLNSGVSSICFSPDGKYLAAGTNEKNAKIFNTSTGELAASYILNDSIYSVCFSPDGKYFAANGLVFSVEEKNGVMSAGKSGKCSFSPDGKYLAVSGSIYKIETGKEIKSFIDGGSISFSPDGKYLAVAKDKYVNIYRTLLQVEEEVLAQKAISLPPSLSAKVSFSEPSGNKILDALEKGKFIVELTNSGKGPAKGVLVKISPSRTENINYNNSYIDEIAPGTSKSVEIPVEAYIGIKDGQNIFKFEFEEVNGFPPAPVELQFETQAYLKPELFIADVGIQDDNGNGKIESGEMINLTVRIGNKGLGSAKSCYAKFYTGDNVFITDAHPKVVKIGDLPFNKTIDVPLQFFVNDKTKDEIPLFVDITEETNLANAPKLRLPVNKAEPIRSISRTVVEGTKEQLGALTIEGGLSVDIEKDIPSTSTSNPNAIALIIGIRDYASTDIPRVEYAKRDAQLIREYLVKVKGFDPKNILPQNPDELMTVGNMKSLLRQKLPSYVKPDSSSEVFIYYSGHGAPSTTTQQPFFVPYDCDPNFVSDDNAYKMSDFYSDIANIKSKRKSVVIDACFSGQSGNGSTIVKNASPVLLKVDSQLFASRDAVIFQSSESNQVSNWYPEKKHGMFTYFFLKGIKGEADLNKDGKITAGELELYINDENTNLPYISQREMQRKQRAIIRGDKETVITVK